MGALHVLDFPERLRNHVYATANPNRVFARGSEKSLAPVLPPVVEWDGTDRRLAGPATRADVLALAHKLEDVRGMMAYLYRELGGKDA